MTSPRESVDSWSWLPRIAAQGILAAITGAIASSRDFVAFEESKSMLSPAQEQMEKNYVQKFFKLQFLKDFAFYEASKA
jgi:hypothetical protein